MYKRITILLAVLCLLLTGCGQQIEEFGGGENLFVYVLDVGQADSILITKGTSAMLIDGGNPGDADSVAEFLQNKGVTKLDYVIGTHPHADHIGGLYKVVSDFDIETILMPKKGATTKAFERLLDAIEEKNLTVKAPKQGDSFAFSDIGFTVFAPSGDSYSNTNDYSIVIKMQYNNVSFLFTADAESRSEEEMLAAGFDLSADVLKVPHHGSKTSSTEAFLEAVRPEVAIISVGHNNTYGLPNDEIIERIEQIGAEIYRTDENGTITISCDGDSFVVDSH